MSQFSENYKMKLTPFSLSCQVFITGSNIATVPPSMLTNWADDWMMSYWNIPQRVKISIDNSYDFTSYPTISKEIYSDPHIDFRL